MPIEELHYQMTDTPFDIMEITTSADVVLMVHPKGLCLVLLLRGVNIEGQIIPNKYIS